MLSAIVDGRFLASRLGLAPNRRPLWRCALYLDRHGLRGDQLRSIVTGKLSSWRSISSIVLSNRPMRTMPSQ